MQAFIPQKPQAAHQQFSHDWHLTLLHQQCSFKVFYKQLQERNFPRFPIFHGTFLKALID
jgi:hypothetical protein